MAEVIAGAVAPVVPVVPASTDAPEIESTADQSTEAPEGEEDKPVAPERKFTQKEVNEIAAKRAAQAERHALKVARAEARAEVAERQLEEARRAPPNAASKDGEPQPNDPKFAGNYEEYLLARAEWRFEQKQAKQQETQQRDSAAQQQGREHAERARQFQETVLAKGRAKYGEDFDAVALDDAVPVTGAMGAAILRLPNGHDVLHHLGMNRAEALRIAQLPEVEQVWELKALESKLTAPPKPTNTPAPIVPGRASATGAKSLADLIGGSQEDFEKRRNERLKAQRARK